MVEKGQQLEPGDVLRNDWVGNDNPLRYTMYLKRGEERNLKTIDCIAYDGRMVRYSELNNKLVFVGHMEWFDKLKSTLSQLNEVKWNEAD